MKNKNKLICIIPGLEKNSYSKKGDLVEWGGTTLLEWKLSQVFKVENLQEIYITTPSSKIKSLAASLGVKTIMRSKGQSLNALYKFIGKKFKNKNILWLNPTSPFLSEKDIKKFIIKYNKVSNHNDSAFTCIQLNEFLFDKKKSLNFNSLKGAISRKKLPNLYQSTNGAYIVSSKTMEEVGSLYGKKPFKHKVTWLQSLEVKSSYELENFKFFMSKYIKQNF
tara:strand:+ start:389 stop:1054 length:666 start_codon:yes stop_codon:yes gene_type:complete